MELQFAFLIIWNRFDETHPKWDTKETQGTKLK